MEIRKAQRKRAKIKVGINGPSGSGKTFSAILLAKGLVNGQLNKVSVIDTENGSADLYSHLGSYNVIPLNTYDVDSFIQAIDIALTAKSEVIIIDSVSHSWEYILQLHSGMSGNSFTNWGILTPIYKKLINKITTSNCHIIMCFRTKQDYVISDKGNNKIKIEKVGLKPIAREGMDYETTIQFDLDSNHNCKASKDRTSMFDNKPVFTISESTGRKILDWCNDSSLPEVSIQVDELEARLKKVTSIKELMRVYNLVNPTTEAIVKLFTSRKNELQPNGSISIAV